MKTLTGLALIAIIAVFGALFLVQCDGGNLDTGTLSLGLTDSPVDIANSVVVFFNGVEAHRSEPTEELLTFAFANSIDLLNLNGGVTNTILSNAVVPEGHYTWIRLMVNSPAGYIVINGTSHDLEVPSGEESGLKLNRGFDVPAGGSADFTIDFDLRKSVHLPSSGDTYLLRPTLRIVDNTEVGRIAGTVDSSLIVNGCTPAVYAFEGSVTPDDNDGSAPEPINSAMVEFSGATYQYKVGFLEAGSYTVAFTCDAAADDPNTNDSITFSSTAVVTVSANSTTTHNF